MVDRIGVERAHTKPDVSVQQVRRRMLVTVTLTWRFVSDVAWRGH